MNLFSMSVFTAIVLLQLLVGCEKGVTSTKAKITVNKVGNELITVKIYHQPIFDIVYLGEIKLDPVQTASLEFAVPKPLMASIQIGEEIKTIFLQPGYDLTISNIGNSPNKQLIFTGQGAEVNNYLLHIASIYEKGLDRNTQNLDLVSFLNRYDSVKEELVKFHKYYTDSLRLSSDLSDLMEKTNRFQLVKMKMMYTFQFHNSALVDQIYAFRDNKEIKAFEMPSELKEAINEIPFDTTFFKMEMLDYKSVLYFYIMESIYSQAFNVQKWDVPNLDLPLISDQKIKQGNYPGIINEFLIANNIRHWMMQQGITVQIDSLYIVFKNDFGSSVFIPDLQKLYEEQVAILPGALAPDFSGQTIGGKKVSLSDFKGKIVYVDVWATWCGPCVEEIPHSKVLQNEFKGNNQVVFLNVSVDRNIDAWKRLLVKETSWGGVHINQNIIQSKSMNKYYKTVGYPQYFLIDQSGIVVTAKASRPSSKRIKDAITSLLK